jgi:hypothetical protein
MLMTKAKTSEVIRLGSGTAPVRLSFPNLAKPKAFQEGQDPRFEATFLMDPSNAEHAKLISKIRAEIKALALEAYGGEIPADLKVCITNNSNKDGSQKKKYDGYAGMVFLTSNNKTRPTIVDRTREPVVEGDKEFPYGGAYVIGTITLWAQNNKFGKRINANLRAIQFVKDGEAFGRGPVAAEDEFDVLEEQQAAARDSASGDFEDDIPF